MEQTPNNLAAFICSLADLLEAIVALPTDMFYNTGIATYVWVLSSKKAEQRNSEANNALPNTIGLFPQYEVKKGNVLMSRASGSIDLIGSVAYVYETKAKILLSDKIFRLHLVPRVNRIFFSFLMQPSYMRAKIERAISGAEGMANNIMKSAVIGFSFALPPKDEQEDIVVIVTKRLGVFDSLINKAYSAITTMQERRTALISAAVTGKIDVRNWQALHD